MSKVVTVMNMKGGVGKTTVSLNLAGIAATYALGSPRPRRVLAIDYDPQFNLSQAFFPAKKYFELEKANKTVLSVLIDAEAALNPYRVQIPENSKPPAVGTLTSRVVGRDNRYLDIIPSTLDLMYVALGDNSKNAKRMEGRFDDFIGECRGLYDLIIIDCHPAGSIFTKTSLRNSDHVLIPVVPQRYSVRGIGLMMNFIDEKKTGAESAKPHILFNKVPRTGVSTEESEIRTNPKYGKYCMTHTLKSFSALAEAEGGQGFVWQSKKPYSTQAFSNATAVASEFINRIGLG